MLIGDYYCCKRVLISNFFKYVLFANEAARIFTAQMLKKGTSIFLIFAVMAANFSWCFIYAGFEVNQQYIADKLCVNKSKPQLNCKGKCFLAKKLKQAEEKEKNDERQAQKNRFQEAIFNELVLLRPVFYQQTKPSFFDLPFYLPKQTSAIFHPPNRLIS